MQRKGNKKRIRENDWWLITCLFQEKYRMAQTLQSKFFISNTVAHSLAHKNLFFSTPVTSCWGIHIRNKFNAIEKEENWKSASYYHWWYVEWNEEKWKIHFHEKRNTVCCLESFDMYLDMMTVIITYVSICWHFFPFFHRFSALGSYIGSVKYALPNMTHTKQEYYEVFRLQRMYVFITLNNSYETKSNK